MKDYPMATRGISPEERAIIDEMQKDIERAKKALNQYKRGAQKIYEIVKAANEPEIAAEAYRVVAAASVAQGYADQAHSAGTDALVRCFDDGGIVVFGGGGR